MTEDTASTVVMRPPMSEDRPLRRRSASAQAAPAAPAASSPAMTNWTPGTPGISGIPIAASAATAVVPSQNGAGGQEGPG